MSRLVLNGGELIVHLSPLERLGALRSDDVRVPLAAVTGVRVNTDPWSEIRGIRSLGTGMPGVISLGTRRGEGWRDFTAVYLRRPAVVVEADASAEAIDADFDRVVVSCVDAQAEADRIQTALPRH